MYKVTCTVTCSVHFKNMWLLAADDPANKQSHDQSLVANRNRDRALLTSSLAFCARSQVFLEAFWLEGVAFWYCFCAAAH